MRKVTASRHRQHSTSATEETVSAIAAHRRQQERVNVYFQCQAPYWRDIYASGRVRAAVFRARQAAALAWIEGLGLRPGARVLEIGCGAGLLAVALAQRGLCVQAIDAAEAMVELARQHALATGTAVRLSVNVGDACALAFADASFDLVLAIGVMDYLTRPELAMREMARVTRPGGHVILTDLNPSGLIIRLDPWENAALRPVMVPLREALARLRPRPWSPERTYHARRLIDEALVGAGLVKTRGKTLGFGPFTFLRRRVLPEALALALHYRLQRLADRGVPLLRSSGVCHLVLARKPASSSHQAPSWTVLKEQA